MTFVFWAMHQRWWNVAVSIGSVKGALTFADSPPQLIRCARGNVGAHCALPDGPCSPFRKTSHAAGRAQWAPEW